MHGYWSNLTQSRQNTIVGLSSMQWINQYAHNLKHDGTRQIKKIINISSINQSQSQINIIHNS